MNTNRISLEYKILKCILRISGWNMDRIIVQQHKLGCGVACVAYVLKCGYSKALRLFNQPENADVKGYWCRELVAALAKEKVDYVHRYFKARYRKILTVPGVIVYTKRSRRYPAGHYLVRTKGGHWMNPWSNFPESKPRRGSLQMRLPGQITYIIFPRDLELSL